MPASSGHRQFVSAPGRDQPVDVNAQIYPYARVQELLDKTANFSMYVIPVAGYSNQASLDPKNADDWFNLSGGYGLDLLSDIHRFESIAETGGRLGLGVRQAIGNATGRMHCVCLFAPADSGWHPGQMPQPRIFDPWRSQRFITQKLELTFGDQHVCQCYGVGRTFPVIVEGRHVLLVGAVANLAAGTGKFAGREGTLVLAGTITGEMGFLGNVNLRVRDDADTLVTDNEPPPLDEIPDSGSPSTFVELRLLKKNQNVRTTFGPPCPDGRVSLVTPSIIRSVQYSYMTGDRGPRTHMSVGQTLGTMEATVFFDLKANPGTADTPVPFTTQELYTFADSAGETVATITCGVTEGQSFGLKFPDAPGQPALRFAGFGLIRSGTGRLAGVQGMLTVNSLIGVSPHALSLMHALHIINPDASLRSTSAY